MSKEDKLKKLQKISGSINQRLDAITNEIKKFQADIKNLNIPFPIEIKLSDKEGFTWSLKRKRFYYYDGEHQTPILSAGIDVRKKFNDKQDEILQIITDRYAQIGVK